MKFKRLPAGFIIPARSALGINTTGPDWVQDSQLLGNCSPGRAD